MKKSIILASLLVSFGAFAQEATTADAEHPNSDELMQRVTNLENQNKKFNLYFNFQGSFDVATDANNDTYANFKARQLRLEAKGNLTDKLSYRFRHRLNKATDAKNLDNLAKATDLMYFNYKANDQLNFTIGKQCQNWGGFEFDINPMNIYEYSDFIDYMDNFMLGAAVSYSPVKNHELVFQVTDVSNNKFNVEYENFGNMDLKASKSPLTYIVNWNGSMLDNKFQTRWAYGIQTLAEGKYSKMVTIGNKLNLPTFQMAVDYMRADEDLDRLKIASGDGAGYLESKGIGYFQDVTYNTFIAKAEYKPAEKWNIFAKGMYETSSVNNVDLYKDYRKAYGYFLGTEYIPFKDQDLRIFLAYIGRKYDFSDKVGIKDYNTNRVSLGFMYKIKAF